MHGPKFSPEVDIYLVADVGTQTRVDSGKPAGISQPNVLILIASGERG